MFHTPPSGGSLPRSQAGKLHVMSNMSSIAAWLLREFQGVSGIIWVAPNSVHQGRRILGAQGNLGARDTGETTGCFTQNVIF